MCNLFIHIYQLKLIPPMGLLYEVSVRIAKIVEKN